MADSTERFAEAIDQLEMVSGELTPQEAAATFDDATLQSFWRRWTHVSGWAGALWRELNDGLERNAAPVVDDLDEVGGPG